MLGSKPIASLSSGLLARKGQARPAMRRHTGLAALSGADDDLGWNDMGEPLPLPPVLEERQHLVEEIAQIEPAAEPAAKGRKAAFTLRLDGERHLRLRLASAARGQSAQVLLVGALDAFIATMPEVGTLRAQLPTPTRTKIVRGTGS
jgi:hypothetical protein